MNGLRARKPFAVALGFVVFATLLAGAPQANPPQPLDRASAQAVFAQIKKLEGNWHAKSTKGWEESEEFRVIARGTAVELQSGMGSSGASKSDGSSNSGMTTISFVDGDRLLLTHYCQAGNHPRLIASSVEDGGRTVHFSFLDATNMASPSIGHMHSLVMTFVDENHFDERWSWHQDGNERWMETIHNERLPAASAKN